MNKEQQAAEIHGGGMILRNYFATKAVYLLLTMEADDVFKREEAIQAVRLYLVADARVKAGGA